MSDPRRNEEGYLDLTAYHGTKNIIQEENEAERKNKDLIHTFRLLADWPTWPASRSSAASH